MLIIKITYLLPQVQVMYIIIDRKTIFANIHHTLKVFVSKHNLKNSYLSPLVVLCHQLSELLVMTDSCCYF